MALRGNAEKAGRTPLEAASAMRRWLGMRRAETKGAALFSSCGSTLGKQASQAWAESTAFRSIGQLIFERQQVNAQALMAPDYRQARNGARALLLQMIKKRMRYLLFFKQGALHSDGISLLIRAAFHGNGESVHALWGKSIKVGAALNAGFSCNNRVAEESCPSS